MAAHVQRFPKRVRACRILDQVGIAFWKQLQKIPRALVEACTFVGEVEGRARMVARVEAIIESCGPICGMRFIGSGSYW